MRIYALLALCVLHARAASIPEHVVEKKLVDVAQQVLDKDAVPADNASYEKELIDQANLVVKDVENNLRVKVADIPVKVVVEDAPALKVSDEIKDEVKEEVKDEVKSEVKDEVKDSLEEVDLSNIEIDLKNIGPPQRQEHETQNPEYHQDPESSVSNVRQGVIDTQKVVRQGFQGVTTDIQNWFSNNEQIASIQQSIQKLQESFTAQIDKLKETVQNIAKPSSGAPVQNDEVNQVKAVSNVQSSLKQLETDFTTGVQALSEGVQIAALLRADNATAGAGLPASSNPILQYLQTLANTIQQGFSSVNANIQNFIQGGGANSTTPAGAQADDAGATTARPTIWQGIQSSLQNIFPGQQAAQAGQPASSNPLAQAIQNNPFVQNVVNLIQPKPSSEKPAAANAQEGSNAVPAGEDKPTDQNQKKEPEQQVVKDGPIKQLIQKNPIAQSIAGAVQRLQSTINNPEKPRDTVKDSNNEKTDLKGGFGGYYGGNNNQAVGDNNNVSSSGLSGKSESVKEEQKEEPAPEVAQKEAEDKPQAASDKTE